MNQRATALILAATSDMARAIAHAFARDGYDLLLTARDPVALEADAADLRIRFGVNVTPYAFDVLDSRARSGLPDALTTLPDVVVCAIGMLGEQQRAEWDQEHAEAVLRTNFEGPAQILGLFANRFAARGYGTLIGISSVAGDRGRATNYVYGAAKAGFTAYLSGLRNRFGRSAIRVITIKPGFVETRMTAGMKLPALVTAQPDEVAAAALKALRSGRDVVYVRPVWRGIMTAIRLLPEPLFKRLRI